MKSSARPRIITPMKRVKKTATRITSAESPRPMGSFSANCGEGVDNGVVNCDVDDGSGTGPGVSVLTCTIVGAGEGVSARAADWVCPTLAVLLAI